MKKHSFRPTFTGGKMRGILLQYRDQNNHVCYAPELDLYGYGPTGTEAKRSLGVVLTEHLRSRYSGITVMDSTAWDAILEDKKRLPIQRQVAVEIYPLVLIYPIQSQLSSLKFPRGYIELHFEDGYVVKLAVSLFPAIQRLTMSQRQEWQILDGVGFTFAESDEGYQVSQFCLDLPEIGPRTISEGKENPGRKPIKIPVKGQIDADLKPLPNLLLKKAKLTESDVVESQMRGWVVRNLDLLSEAEVKQFKHLLEP